MGNRRYTIGSRAVSEQSISLYIDSWDKIGDTKYT